MKGYSFSFIYSFNPFSLASVVPTLCIISLRNQTGIDENSPNSFLNRIIHSSIQYTHIQMKWHLKAFLFLILTLSFPKQSNEWRNGCYRNGKQLQPFFHNPLRIKWESKRITGP